MVLGKLPVPGRPTIWMIVGQGPTALAVGAGGGCLDIFILVYPFSPLSPSLWETARYRLKYCLKGPLNPNQPTNQWSWSYVTCIYFNTVLIPCHRSPGRSMGSALVASSGPARGEIFSTVNGAPLHTAFHFQLFIVLIWLKYCWRPGSSAG